MTGPETGGQSNSEYRFDDPEVMPEIKEPSRPLTDDEASYIAGTLGPAIVDVLSDKSAQ